MRRVRRGAAERSSRRVKIESMAVAPDGAKRKGPHDVRALMLAVHKAPPGFEPGVEVLQTSALPLGYGAAGQQT